MAGGGVLGLATALTLTRQFPKIRVVLLEKEPTLAQHQSGRNSGVIHSGIYYRPGSLKAKLCVKGSQALFAFCEVHGIPTQRCGKVIVATSEEELPRLHELYQRGIANGLQKLSLIGPDELGQIEPHAAGIKAIHIPSVGIVDYRQVASAFADQIQVQGGKIQTATQLLRTVQKSDGWILETSSGPIPCRFLVSCGGLHSDRIARMGGNRLHLKIIPFRGEYYELIHSQRHLVRGLIYPVPDPRLPFLGVHLTRTIDGHVEAGPNAVIALKREGYRKNDADLPDTLEMLRFVGLWRMIGRHWKQGLQEVLRSANKSLFVRSVQRLLPAVGPEDLIPSLTGVRAQAVDNQGILLDDFCLIQGAHQLHVVNAPSPAATASLAIGEFIAQESSRQFGL